MIEHLQLLENDKARPFLFYRQSRKFYDGFLVVVANEIEQAKISNMNPVQDIAMTPDITVSMVLFHFSIELLLKALIKLNDEKFNKNTHDLKELVETVKKYYPNELNTLSNNEIIKTLSGKNSVNIRYLEVFIYQSDVDKLNILLEQCKDIYCSIYKIWNKEVE